MKNILRNERGSAGANAVIALIVLVVFVYAGIQIAPIYWAHWNLEDDIKAKVQFAFVNYKSKEVQKRLTNDIYGMLNNIDAQYEKKNVRVKVDEASKKILIEIWYSRSHKFPIYPPNPKPFYIKVENSPI